MSRLQTLFFASLISILSACGPAETPEPDGGQGNGTGTPDAGNGSGNGSGTGGTPDAGPSLPTTITVNGTLVGLDGHAPDHTLSIVIGSASPVSSSADGTFQVTGVETPYDVTVIDGTNKSAIQYLQVSRADPQLLIPSSSRSAAHQAQISGVVSGGEFPQPAKVHTSLLLSSERNGWFGWAGSEGSYSLSGIRWAGADTLSSRLIALQFELDAALLPARFIGFASKAMTLSGGGTFSNNAMGMVSVTTGTLSGSMGVPTGYSLSGRNLWLRFGVSTLSFGDASTSDGFSYLTPMLSEGHAVLVGKGIKGNSVSYHYKPVTGFTGTGVRLEVRAAPEPLLPTDAATGVGTSMEFSWSPYAEGSHLITFWPTESEGPVIYVVTRQTSAHLPDLAQYGMSLPHGAKYAWTVEGFAPLATMDEAASVSFRQQWWNLFPTDFHWATTLQRTFTTQ